MKYIIGSILLILVIVSSVMFFFKKEIRIQNIQYFEYQDGDVFYKISVYQNKIVATYKKSGEGSKSLEIEKDVMKQLEIILNHYQVRNWIEFGDELQKQYSFSILYDKNQKIEISGYQKYPKNYKKVKKEMKILFMEIFHENRRG